MDATLSPNKAPTELTWEKMPRMKTLVKNLPLGCGSQEWLVTTILHFLQQVDPSVTSATLRILVSKVE